MNPPIIESEKFFFFNSEISLLRNAAANFFKLSGIMLSFAFIVFTVSGPILLFFSLYQYFRIGHWIYYDNSLILYCFSDLRAWLDQPHSWFGLQRLVKWMFTYLPMGLLTLPTGLILAFLSAGILIGNGLQLHEKKIAKNS